MKDRQGRGVPRTLARAAAVAGRRVTGLCPQVLAELVAEAAAALAGVPGRTAG
jgi:hypothetical protein